MPRKIVSRSRSRSPSSSPRISKKKSSGTKRKMTPWNHAMKMATQRLRASNPGLVGSELFKKGAVVAHKIMESPTFKRKYGC